MIFQKKIFSSWWIIYFLLFCFKISTRLKQNLELIRGLLFFMQLKKNFWWKLFHLAKVNDFSPKIFLKLMDYLFFTILFQNIFSLKQNLELIRGLFFMQLKKIFLVKTILLGKGKWFYTKKFSQVDGLFIFHNFVSKYRLVWNKI